MSPSPPPADDPEKLRTEASVWFARMRGPDADAHRAAFEAWLAASARHRTTYNRLGEVFALGKVLRSDAPMPSPPALAPAHQRRGQTAIVAVALAITVTAALIVQRRAAGQPDFAAVASARSAGSEVDGRVQTALGQIRRFRLTDGSTVILDTDARIAVGYGERARRLRVLRGRARFDVVHDGRPFIVAAGAMLVTARGTLFDVSYDSKTRASVDLLRGAIDVSAPAAIHKWTRRLRPGDSVTVTTGTGTPEVRATDAGDREWPSGRIDFDRAPLADVIDRANPYSAIPITLDAPDAADLRVSGSFRVIDTDQLVSRLALLFDLDVDRSDPTKIVLRRRTLSR